MRTYGLRGSPLASVRSSLSTPVSSFVWSRDRPHPEPWHAASSHSLTVSDTVWPALKDLTTLPFSPLRTLDGSAVNAAASAPLSSSVDEPLNSCNPCCPSGNWYVCSKETTISSTPVGYTVLVVRQMHCVPPLILYSLPPPFVQSVCFCTSLAQGQPLYLCSHGCKRRVGRAVGVVCGARCAVRGVRAEVWG